MDKLTKDLKESIVEKLTAKIKEGVLPWAMPWATSGPPHNFSTKKNYRGINWLMLGLISMTKGYSTSAWITFNQARKLKGKIKKGSKSTMIVFFKPLVIKDRENEDETKTIPLWRYYNVFNLDQVDGLQEKTFEELNFQPIAEAENIVYKYRDRPTIEHKGEVAYYNAIDDLIIIPETGRFKSIELYYSSIFHELIHSTGHKARLKRFNGNSPSDKNTEELIAEIGAAMLCGHSRIQNEYLMNASASYVKSWLKRLEKDAEQILSASFKAQHAIDYILTGRTNYETKENSNG